MKRWKSYSLLVLFSCLLSCIQPPKEELPIYNPSDLNPELVDKNLQNKHENHEVLDFQLINQNGKKITQEDYENSIYVVDFFFTRCPSICPIMTDNMVRIQQKFHDRVDVKLLSISVTPEIDSVSVLRKYANDKGVLDDKWNVTTGNKKHIYNLARKSYFAAIEKGDGELQDFIHTPNFVLVDKKKQIRGVYDGTDATEIDRLIDDIDVLSN